MPYHDWSDKWFEKNGDDLYRAIRLFDNIHRHLRGMFFFTKEKYGTMRIEANYGGVRIDSWLLRKNLIYHHYPRLRKISKVVDRFNHFIGIDKLIYKWQRLVFNIATFITVKTYPNVKEEITSESDFAELLYSWTKRLIKYENHWVKVS